MGAHKHDKTKCTVNVSWHCVEYHYRYCIAMLENFLHVNGICIRGGPFMCTFFLKQCSVRWKHTHSTSQKIYLAKNMYVWIDVFRPNLGTYFFQFANRTGTHAEPTKLSTTEHCSFEQNVNKMDNHYAKHHPPLIAGYMAIWKTGFNVPSKKDRFFFGITFLLCVLT